MILSHRPFVLASLLAAALLASSTGTAGAASGFTSVLERALKKLDRDLCKSVEGLKCKRKAPASRATTRKSRAKPAVEKQVKPAAEKPAKPATANALPIPRQKPAQAAEAKPVDAKSAETNATEIHMPRTKPAMPDAVSAETPAPLPKEKPVLPQNEPKIQVTVLLPVPPVAKIVIPPLSTQPEGQCRDALRSLGMSFETPATSVNSGLCTVTDPVKLSSFSASGETIAFPDQPVLNCAFALRFGEWLKAEGAPIAKKTANSALDKFYTGPGYQCRGRNGDSMAKISEHGYGNAVDITFVKLKDGRTFEVKDALDPVSPAYRTLSEFRASGCKYFTTVLGPGANAAHAEHFHFDMGKHGKSGTYRICQ